ncbi:MAG: hypothetical protein COA79_13480 [Planctomycetota bacterium]|nr:MAG: hypothetical protein COA79_13480 [Planctomycetota bacterium]
MKTIDKYLTGHFFRPFIISIVVFIGLFTFIDSAEKLRSFLSFSNSHSNGIVIIGKYMLSNALFYFISFLPIILALTAAMIHVNLNKTGQIIALYSFGLHHVRIFRYPLIWTFLIGLIVLLLNFFILPDLYVKADQYNRVIKNRELMKKGIVFQENIDLFQLKNEILKNKSIHKKEEKSLLPIYSQVMNIRNFNNESIAEELNFTRLDNRGNVRQRGVFTSCKLVSDFWKLNDGVLIDYLPNGEKFREKKYDGKKSFFLISSYDLTGLNAYYYLFKNPKKVKTSSLFKFYGSLESRQELWRRFMLPLRCICILLCAIGLSVFFNIKRVYFGFAILIMVGLLDLIGSNVSYFLISPKHYILSAVFGPIFLFLVGKYTLKPVR